MKKRIVSSGAYSAYRSVSPSTGNTMDAKFFTHTLVNSDTEAIVNYVAKWTGNICINSNNNAAALFAVYGVNGNLLAVKMLDKNSGLRNGINKDVRIAIEDLPTTWKIHADLIWGANA